MIIKEDSIEQLELVGSAHWAPDIEKLHVHC